MDISAKLAELEAELSVPMSYVRHVLAGGITGGGSGHGVGPDH